MNTDDRRAKQAACSHVNPETIREGRNMVTYCKNCNKTLKIVEIPESAH